ncbi:MAG: hypothetical protein ACM3MK_02080 [Chitinophagales bacterium]
MSQIDLAKVKGFMVQNGMNEPRFACEMGISYSYLFRVFRGQRLGGRKFITGLIQAGMPLEDIFLPPVK